MRIIHVSKVHAGGKNIILSEMSCSFEYSIERDNFYDLASARQFKFDTNCI